MRTSIAILTAAVLLSVATPGRAAYMQGPWCAGQSAGPGGWRENCSLPSLEVCRREVIAGNRGVCFPNPAWMGYAPEPPRRGRRVRR